MTAFQRYLNLLTTIRTITKECGRTEDSVTLVAVTKNQSIKEILPAFEAGCIDFGENRVQESLEKMSSFPHKVRWHFIGPLQSNKVRKIIGKFHLIHSVDSKSLAEKISACSVEMGCITPILLQVNTSGEKSKQGFSPTEFANVINELIHLPGLYINGLMTMAPFVDQKQIIRHCFRDLKKIRDDAVAKSGHRLTLKDLSMGMSHDYRLAIEEGATLIRIGSAIFSK